jgi:hypothetical protein
MIKGLTLSALLLGGIAGGALGASDVSITLKHSDTETPAVDVEVSIFLSTGVLRATTDEDGVALFEDVVGRGFWVEVNGERLRDFYYVADSPLEILVNAEGGGK